MEGYKREQKCELCGNIFIITKKCSRTRRCNDCLQSIKYGIKVKEADKKAPEKAIKIMCGKSMSKLDTLVMEAKMSGMTYGQYMALRPLVKTRRTSHG